MDNKKYKTKVLGDSKTKVLGESKTKVLNENKTKVLGENKTKVLGEEKNKKIDNNKTKKMDENKTKKFDDNISTDTNAENIRIFEEGEVIDGKYIIKKLLTDQTGQSSVYIVSDEEGNTLIAKIYLTNKYCIDESIVNTLKGIRNKNIIPILDSNRFDKYFYTITPYYEEGSLEDSIDKLDNKLIMDKYISQINEGIHFLHEAGIIHADLKPGNIYLENNGSNVVLGDFGIAVSLKNSNKGFVPRRELKENMASIAYIPPYDYDKGYISRESDYYAFGMTILDLINKDIFFKDVEDDKIRDVMLQEKIVYPSEAVKKHPELIMLIDKLLDINNKKRAGYDDVKSWCKNHFVFGNYYDDSIGDKCRVKISGLTIKGKLIKDTIDYTEFLLKYFDSIGLKKFKGEMDEISVDISKCCKDDSIIDEFIDLQTKFENAPKIGLMLSLMKMNPYLPFNPFGYSFTNFDGYIDYLNTCLVEKQKPFYNYNLLIQQIENEELVGTISKEYIDKVREVLNYLEKDNSNISFEFKIETLRNYFFKSNDIIIGNKLYKGYDELSDSLFDTNFEPINNKELFCDITFDLISFRNKFDDDKKEALFSILKIKDNFERNVKFSLFFTNKVRYHYKNKNLFDLTDFILFAKDIYEDQKDPSFLVKLLKNGRILSSYKYAGGKDSRIISLLSSFVNSSSKDSIIFTKFYNETTKNSKLIYNGRVINDLKELIELLSNSNNLSYLSSNLIADPQFKIWLSGNGYEEALDLIEGKKKEKGNEHGSWGGFVF